MTFPSPINYHSAVWLIWHSSLNFPPLHNSSLISLGILYSPSFSSSVIKATFPETGRVCLHLVGTVFLCCVWFTCLSCFPFPYFPLSALKSLFISSHVFWHLCLSGMASDWCYQLSCFYLIFCFRPFTRHQMFQSPFHFCTFVNSFHGCSLLLCWHSVSFSTVPLFLHLKHCNYRMTFRS